MKVPGGSTWKAQLGFGCAIVALLAVGATSYRARIIAVESDRWVRHTHEVIEALQDLRSAMKTAESGSRGFIITGKESYLQSHRAGVALVHQGEEAFGTLTLDNPVQQRRLAAIEDLASRRLARTALVIGLRQTGGFEAAADAMREGSGQALMNSFEGLVREAREEELRLLAIRGADADRQLNWTNALLVLGTFLGVLIAAGAGWSVVRDNALRRLAEESLREGEERFRTLANNISQMAWMADPNGSFLWFNDRWFEFTGIALSEMKSGSDWRNKVHHPDHMRRVVDTLRQATLSGVAWEDTYPLRGRDGLYRWFLSRAVPIRDAQGKVLRWFGTSTDITESKLLEAALFEERERAQITLKSIGDAVACADSMGKISFINVVAETLTGWSSQDAVGRTTADVLRIVDATTRETILNPMQIAVAQNQSVSLPSNSVLIRRDGSETPIEDSVAPIHDREGQVTGAVIVFRDVSEARAMSLQMAHFARHDFLTGLPNRMLLNDRIGQAIALAPRHKKKVAVLFLDLDGFKQVNDALGHAVGDKLLEAIGKRLVSCVRVSDTISRLGGDEFVALLSEIDQAKDAALSATRMLQAVADVRLTDHPGVRVATSIGISIYPEDGVDAETLIKNADTAMYEAKEKGRETFRFFNAALNGASHDEDLVRIGHR